MEKIEIKQNLAEKKIYNKCYNLFYISFDQQLKAWVEIPMGKNIDPGAIWAWQTKFEAVFFCREKYERSSIDSQIVSQGFNLCAENDTHVTNGLANQYFKAQNKRIETF